MEDVLTVEPYDAPRMVGAPAYSEAPVKLKVKRAPSAYNMFQKIQMARMGADMSGRDRFSRIAGMWSELPGIEKERMKSFLKHNMQILEGKVADPKARFDLVAELWIEMQ